MMNSILLIGLTYLSFQYLLGKCLKTKVFISPITFNAVKNTEVEVMYLENAYPLIINKSSLNTSNNKNSYEMKLQFSMKLMFLRFPILIAFLG